MSSDSEEKAKLATSKGINISTSEWLKVTLIDRVRKAIDDLPPDFHLIPSLIPDADKYKVKVAHLCSLVDEAREELHSLKVQLINEPDNYEELKPLIDSVESVINDGQEKLDLYYDSIARIVDPQVFICKNQFIDMYYGIIIRRAQSILKQIDDGTFTGHLENTINFLLARCKCKLSGIQKERKICTGPGNELRKEELKKVKRHLKLLIILLDKKKPTTVTNMSATGETVVESEAALLFKTLTAILFGPSKRALEDLPSDFPYSADSEAEAASLSFLLDMAKQQQIYVNERKDQSTEEVIMIKKELETIIYALEEKLDMHKEKRDLSCEFQTEDQVYNVLYGTIIRRAHNVLRDIDNGKISKNVEKITESLLQRCTDKFTLLQKEKKIWSVPQMEAKIKEIEALSITLKEIILQLKNHQSRNEQNS